VTAHSQCFGVGITQLSAAIHYKHTHKCNDGVHAIDCNLLTVEPFSGKTKEKRVLVDKRTRANAHEEKGSEWGRKRGKVSLGGGRM